MKKSLLLPAVIVFALEIANAQSPGFLHAKNSRIIDGQGREVILRGMGLGGWMLQEGYMLGINKEGPNTPSKLESPTWQARRTARNSTSFGSRTT